MNKQTSSYIFFIIISIISFIFLSTFFFKLFKQPEYYFQFRSKLLYIDNIIKKTVDCPNPLNTNLNILRKNLDANQIFIAHRLGGITERQENNILFFEDALKRGFNFFETDIYVYEDQLYLYHPKDNQTQSDILKIINKDKSLNDFDDLINKIKSINANILVILDIKNNQNRLDIFNLIEKKNKTIQKKIYYTG